MYLPGNFYGGSKPPPYSKMVISAVNTSSEEAFTSPEGWNKLPLTRELSPKVTEGEKSLTHFDVPSGKLLRREQAPALQ